MRIGMLVGIGLLGCVSEGIGGGGISGGFGGGFVDGGWGGRGWHGLVGVGFDGFVYG